MAKTLLLWSVVLILAASAAFAAPPAPAAPSGAQPVKAAPILEPTAAPLCLQAADVFAPLNLKLVPICQGDGCSKTADCRPAGLPECANCWCVGPAGDKSCACF